MKKIIPIIIFLFLSFSVLSILINNYKSVSVDGESESSFVCEEYEIRDTVASMGITHRRSWQNSRAVLSYCMDYMLKDEHYHQSKVRRNGINEVFRYDSFEEYWGSVYKALLSDHPDQLYHLQDSLRHIADKDSLTNIEFADMLVSFIQDIPYSFIKSKDCDPEVSTPCVPGQKFGILSPVEFLYTLRGDCDTRTTVLYKLLKHFGYDVKVVVSSEYAHAMLAVNLPATGVHLTYRGKRYYFWETTNTGWQPGMLSADMKNLNYWKIALY